MVDVLRSGQLSLGPWIDRFEELFAERVGAPYAAAVSCGTAGLHLLCRSAGLGPGDEVITSPYSFVASANCAIYEGATPVFADVDPRTLNLDPDAVEAAITPRTKAVIAVDIYGYPCELDPLRDLCRRHGLALVHDACEALGASYHGAPVGVARPLGCVRVLSEQADRRPVRAGSSRRTPRRSWRLLKSLRNQGRADGGGWLEHARLGFNYRIDDIRAAIGIGQLEKLDGILALRRAVADRYTELLRASTGSRRRCPTTPTTSGRGSSTSSKLPAGADRERVISSLEHSGVATARYLPSIHLQPYMRERYGFREGQFPVSEDASRRTLAIPFHTRLAAADQEHVAEALAEALA